jgi:hypothetical protein
MAQKLSALAGLLYTNAANVATQMGGGTTQAEVEDLGKLLTAIAPMPEVVTTYSKRALPTVIDQVLPG